MKFSLIIGTLNRCAELEICLNSLRKQKFRVFEVKIVDQSTDDSTQQLVSKYQDLRIVRRQEKRKTMRVVWALYWKKTEL